MIHMEFSRKKGETATKTMERVLARVGRKVQMGLYEVGGYIKTRSMEECPVDTDTLQSSARMTSTGQGLSTQVVVGFGGTDHPEVKAYSPKEGRWVKRKPSEYAVYVHEGTPGRGIESNPWLGRVVDGEQDQMRAVLNSTIQRTR